MYLLVMASGPTIHALLGLLSIKPMSGYDIRQMIPESIGHFWTESYGQIYPALRGMTAEGLVEKRTETLAGRPDRHVYTLTGAGRERLREWLKVSPGTEVLRNELLLKLFFGAHVPVSVNRGHVLEFLERQERELRMFVAIAEFLRKEHAGHPQLPYWLITLNRGRHDAMSAAAWARETLEALGSVGGDGPLDGVGSARGTEAGDGA